MTLAQPRHVSFYTLLWRASSNLGRSLFNTGSMDKSVQGLSQNLLFPIPEHNHCSLLYLSLPGMGTLYLPPPIHFLHFQTCCYKKWGTATVCVESTYHQPNSELYPRVLACMALESQRVGGPQNMGRGSLDPRIERGAGGFREEHWFRKK